MSDATQKPAIAAPEAGASRNKRVLALMKRIGTIADLACSKPLEGELGGIAYDLLRQAAAQISSDRLRLAAQAQPTPSRDHPLYLLLCEIDLWMHDKAEEGSEGDRLHAKLHDVLHDFVAHATPPRTANHAGWIDQRALEIAQGIAAENNITDVQYIARIQIGAIEGIKSMLPAPSRGESGTSDAVARMADDCRQRAIQMVKAQRKQWFCSGEDCTRYDHGRDEGFDLALKAIGLLAPFTDEVQALLSTMIPVALPAASDEGQRKLAEADARAFGNGFIVKGHRVDPREVTILKPTVRNRGDQ